MFTWYWVADLCEQEGIDFILDHALYMKAIHGGKAKNDKIDSRKIAGLMRGGIVLEGQPRGTGLAGEKVEPAQQGQGLNDPGAEAGSNRACDAEA